MLTKKIMTSLLFMIFSSRLIAAFHQFYRLFHHRIALFHCFLFLNHHFVMQHHYLSPGFSLHLYFSFLTLQRVKVLFITVISINNTGVNYLLRRPIQTGKQHSSRSISSSLPFELNAVREYIIDNPSRWDEDKFNVEWFC